MKQNEEKHLMSEIQFFSLPKTLYSTKVYAFEQCVYVSHFYINSALGEFAMIYVTTYFIQE